MSVMTNDAGAHVSFALREPLLAPKREPVRMHRTTFVAVAALVFAVVCLTSYRGANPSRPAPDLVEVSMSTMLLFGEGGAYWANCTEALASRGAISWACRLSPSQLHPAGGGVALVEEDTATVVAWHPHGEMRRAALVQLRRPVACRQIGGFVYVACFGVEGEAGRAGLAIVRVRDWVIVRERVVGTHVHNVYGPSLAGGRLVFTDLGDPWVDPPVLGGLFHIDPLLEGQPARVGPQMHARAAAFPEPPVDGAMRDGPPAALHTVHVITQQPFGQATRVVTLSAEAQLWAGQAAAAGMVASASLELPLPALPADGGADIFRLGGRLFCTDRYGGPGRLFELEHVDEGPVAQSNGTASARLAVAASVELGVQPRYTVAAPTGGGSHLPTWAPSTACRRSMGCSRRSRSAIKAGWTSRRVSLRSCARPAF
mmetsp:Transcript_57611/g.171374  ORF Transcript_57611/g.171374 Transcript_57611/m.171374 type:complete len:428 (-) Transcript_57611:73-1356(-)